MDSLPMKPREKISVEALRGVSVLFPDDVYELACFLLKMNTAKGRGTTTIIRNTVFGLATMYERISEVDRRAILRTFRAHRLPLGATVECDDDVGP